MYGMIGIRYLIVERALITIAATQIDILLGDDPHGQGESRPGGRRITFVAPLGLFYRIDPNDRVTVIQVWTYRTHHS